MKKSIASAALLASAASAFALIGPHATTPSSQVQAGGFIPGDVPTERFYCLSVYENEEGSKILGSCDEFSKNLQLGLETNEQGCTESQAALRVTKNIQIMACPSYAQL